MVRVLGGDPHRDLEPRGGGRWFFPNSGHHAFDQLVNSELVTDPMKFIVRGSSGMVDTDDGYARLVLNGLTAFLPASFGGLGGVDVPKFDQQVDEPQFLVATIRVQNRLMTEEMYHENKGEGTKADKKKCGKDAA